MDKIRISFTGDILVYECQNKLCKVGKDKYDYTDYFKDVKSVFEDSDYIVGSLETPLAGKKAKYTHEDTCFNTPDDILESLRMIGVNMLTTGNNHALDRGKEGLKRTIRILDKFGFDHTGTATSSSTRPYIVKEIGGVKVAFLSYTYGTNSSVNECLLGNDEKYMVNLTRRQDLPPHRSLIKQIVRKSFLSLPKVVVNYIRPVAAPGIVVDCVNEKEIDSIENRPYVDLMLNAIKDAKKDADVVIFCLHSGGQFNSEVTGYTKWLIDVIVRAGVDAVVTNHTHTPLSIERRDNGCIVAYSLGNFSFTPGVGYYVEGVGAEFSKVLNITIDKDTKQIVGYILVDCVSIVDKKGYAHVKLLNNM